MTDIVCLDEADDFDPAKSELIWDHTHKADGYVIALPPSATNTDPLSDAAAQMSQLHRKP